MDRQDDEQHWAMAAGILLENHATSLQRVLDEKRYKCFAGGGWIDKLLGRKSLMDNVERLFVKYRMLRKKALRLTIERLRANLASDSAEL